MKSLWDEGKTVVLDSALAECAHTAGLIGADERLVLHGGGNSSFKNAEADLFGEPRQVLWVKASGYDMASIGVEGFAPVDLERVRRLVDLPELSDMAMANELRAALIDVTAPGPSVETLLHAVIPRPAIHHAHPDALLAISNTVDGLETLMGIYGDQVIVVPYHMSGFSAAKAVAEHVTKFLTDHTVAVILVNHGVFAFGETPHEAYERLIDVVTTAESFLTAEANGGGSPTPDAKPPTVDRVELAELRRQISKAADRPMIVTRHIEDDVWSFCHRGDLADVALRGPVTPDHVIWTKRTPLIGRDVDSFVDEYRHYFAENAEGRSLTMLDPAPRIVLDPELGMLSVGTDVKSAAGAGELYRHTMWVIERASGLGGYRPPSPREIFDLEYWELEQAKLGRADDGKPFTGEVALVTGAASGIGRACAADLLANGAAVIGLDINESVDTTFDVPEFLGIRTDVSHTDQVSAAIDTGVERFGGLDMVVAAAGLFPESAPIAQHDSSAWRMAMSVNVDGFVGLLSMVHPLLVRAPRKGRVAVIGSKNVAAPGPGASAYSASKAAANQIARVAALEWAADGIRINSVHPDAIFDTGLWTPELLAQRAARYGMTIEQYKRRNLLKAEIPSSSVARVVSTLLGPVFEHITGAHIPIDGGNDRVI